MSSGHDLDLGTGKPDWYTITAKRIKDNEGWAPEPYKDHKGNWTFGWGFLMETREGGIPVYIPTEAEGDAILEVKIRERFHQAAHLFKGLGLLDDTRTSVLVEMVYQIGYGNLGEFPKFRAAVGRKDWPAAKYHMLDSDWAREDSPGRALELAELLLNGDE